MLSVHLKSDLYIVGIRVTYVTSLVATFPDLKQIALQVVLQLALVLLGALCSESSSDVTTCSDVTSVGVVHLHSSALRVGTSCCHSSHFNCLPFNRRSIQPAVAQSIFHHLSRSKDHVPVLGGRVLFQILIVRRTVSKSCRQIRFFQGPQLQSDAQTTPLSRGVCASAAPQNERQAANCNLNRNTVKWDINVDVVHTASSVSEVETASRSEACRCCTWNCSLSVRNRRNTDSPRTCTSVARQTSTNLPSSRTGTVRTLFESASSMRAFSCAECEAVHSEVPEEVGWVRRAGASCHCSTSRKPSRRHSW